TGTRTLATVTSRQISNLLRYHSGTSPLLLRRVISCIADAKVARVFVVSKYLRHKYLKKREASFKSIIYQADRGNLFLFFFKKRLLFPSIF
ncbi:MULTISPECIES: hypothetical protein, partial [unclassified Myroides]|uniref:hypothetical protein n=1 Tax=unclassified Myroides TaxID=2642485 RepID=UPI003D2F68B2